MRELYESLRQDECWLNRSISSGGTARTTDVNIFQPHAEQQPYPTIDAKAGPFASDKMSSASRSQLAALLTSIRSSASRPGPTAKILPHIPCHGFACVAAGDIGELAFEGTAERETVGPSALDGSCGERGVGGLRRAAHDEGGAGQRLEGRGDTAVGIVIVRPGETPRSVRLRSGPPSPGLTGSRH
jgi:hypothetical protein